MIYFIQEVTVHHWHKSSEEPRQDRNMEQKPSANTANWLTLSGFVTQLRICYLEMVPLTVGLLFLY